MNSASLFGISLIAIFSAGCGGGVGSTLSASPSVRSVDLAVDGEGLLTLALPDGPAYLHGGTFGVDSRGVLVQTATGVPLLGWSAKNDPIGTPTPPESLSIPLGRTFPPRATTAVLLFGNLQAGLPEETPVKSQLRVYGEHGNAHDLTFVFRRVDQLDSGAPAEACSNWSWVAFEGAISEGVVVGASSTAGNSKIDFDQNGAQVSKSTQFLTLPRGKNRSLQPIRIDFARMHQYAADAEVIARSEDGSPGGTLQSYEVKSDGAIVGTFSSGSTKLLGRIGLTKFGYPPTLLNLGNGLQRPTVDNSAAIIDKPEPGFTGSVIAQSLQP